MFLVQFHLSSAFSQNASLANSCWPLELISYLFVFVVFDIGLWIAWSNFDLDLSWPVGFLLKCVAVLAQVDCFAFHLYYTNNLFIFVHVQQLVIGLFKKKNKSQWNQLSGFNDKYLNIHLETPRRGKGWL